MPPILMAAKVSSLRYEIWQMKQYIQ